MKRYVAIAVTAGAFAVAVGAGAAPPPDDGVELVWGGGAPPAYAAKTAQPGPGARHSSTVELHWGSGGPPQYVTVPAN